MTVRRFESVDSIGSLAGELTRVVQRVFSELGLDVAHATVEDSQRPELGQFQCNGAMPLARRLGKNPRELAAAVVEKLAADPRFRDVSIAGPGFINFSAADVYLGEFVDALRADERFGCAPMSDGALAVLDFGGPNVAKSMHVGHLRSSILGDCLQRLLRFAGHRVLSDIHLGDWGTQMGMLIVEAARRWPELPYFDAARRDGFPSESPVTLEQLNQMYPVASARCADDPAAMAAARLATAELQDGRPGYRALWQHFVDVTARALRADFALLDVHFDLWDGESTLQDRVGPLTQQLVDSGLAVRSDGALIVPLDDVDLPPFILQKSDGASLYSTTDLATLRHRSHDLGAALVLYIVDARQKVHFRQLFAVAVRSGLAGSSTLEHVEFGTVNGPDGRPFKTRAGGVVQLRDLLNMATRDAAAHMEEGNLGADLPAEERQELASMVGLGAVRFADLMHNRASNYIFDLARFTSFDGCTGPYLQYTATRMKSIQRKAAERSVPAGSIIAPTDDERPLLLRLAAFPVAIERAYLARAPHRLCEYAYELCRDFNRFYHDVPVLHHDSAAVRGSRLALVAVTLGVLELIMGLIGLRVPERM